MLATTVPEERSLKRTKVADNSDFETYFMGQLLNVEIQLVKLRLVG
jgi:hypothetical protein